MKLRPERNKTLKLKNLLKKKMLRMLLRKKREIDKLMKKERQKLEEFKSQPNLQTKLQLNLEGKHQPPEKTWMMKPGLLTCQSII